jgi:hypothetical protein
MVNEGFEAGLRYWLVFLLGFFLLGYSAQYSIFLGGLAGLAGGILAAYWKQKELPPPPSDGDEDAPTPFRGVTRRLQQWRKEQKDQTGRSPSIANWFGRRPKRSLKSPRR